MAWLVDWLVIYLIVSGSRCRSHNSTVVSWAAGVSGNEVRSEVFCETTMLWLGSNWISVSSVRNGNRIMRDVQSFFFSEILILFRGIMHA